MNTLKLYLLERHVFRQKSCNFDHGLEKMSLKSGLITFFQSSQQEISPNYQKYMFSEHIKSMRNEIKISLDLKTPFLDIDLLIFSMVSR